VHNLMYPSRTRGLLPVLKTNNEDRSSAPHWSTVEAQGPPVRYAAPLSRRA
jgi:hypothetical protein